MRRQFFDVIEKRLSYHYEFNLNQIDVCDLELVLILRFRLTFMSYESNIYFHGVSLCDIVV